MSPTDLLLVLPLALGAGPPTVGEFVGVVALAFAATAAISRAVLVLDRAVAGGSVARVVSGVRPADRPRLLVAVVALAAVAFAGLFLAVGWV